MTTQALEANDTKALKANNTKAYVVVWFILGILTALEILAATQMPSGATSRWLALVLLAVAKAGAVALWYMHLKWETGWLRFIAVLPAIAGAYAIVLILEVVARQIFWSPFPP